MKALSCNGVRKQLRNLKQPVTLFGSRLYGTHTKSSDWDFFTEDTEYVRGQLEKLEFRFRSPASDNYNDSLFVQRSRHIDHPIDVVLVRDWYQKLQAVHLSQQMPEYVTDRTIRLMDLSLVWNILHTIANIVGMTDDMRIQNARLQLTRSLPKPSGSYTFLQRYVVLKATRQLEEYPWFSGVCLDKLGNDLAIRRDVDAAIQTLVDDTIYWNGPTVGGVMEQHKDE